MKKGGLKVLHSKIQGLDMKSPLSERFGVPLFVQISYGLLED